MRRMEQKRIVLLILGGNIETKLDQGIAALLQKVLQRFLEMGRMWRLSSRKHAYIMLTTFNPTFI